MPHLDTCVGILRRLIAKGDVSGMPLAREGHQRILGRDVEGGQKERPEAYPARRAGAAERCRWGAARFCPGRKRLHRKEGERRVSIPNLHLAVLSER